MSALNSFGAIMTHAIELEAQIAAYYKAAGVADRAAESEKRRSTLERVRRENVVEIMLEPIEGLNVEDYALNLSDSSAAGQQAVEKIAAKFYADVSPKINVKEAERALAKAGKQHAALAG